MTILTRIKNNQVTDNTIEYQKLKDGTLVGSKFNANLTLNSNVTILGNLTVANSFAQLNSINTYINDPIVVFNNNYTGSPTYDIGMLINRNLDSLAPYGAVNAAFVWKEASSAFEGLMTTETGTTAGDINNSGFANLFIGNIGANTLIIRDTTTSTDYTNGALAVAGAVGIGGNVNVNGTSRFASNVVMHSATESTSLTTGALVVVGGVGISRDLNVGGRFEVDGDAIIDGNLTVNGVTTTIGTTDLAIQDAVLNLHTLANLAPLTTNDGKDIGIKFHYFTDQDEHAFLGRANDSGYLEWYDSGRETGNVFSGNTYGTIKAGEFFSANVTDSSSISTGAIRTRGGAGIYANLYVGKSATFNANAAANQNVTIKGVNDNTLFWARSDATYDQIIIGNSATTSEMVTGAKLIINTTDSIILPSGTNAQRPGSTGGTDTLAMLRYNTTGGYPEYYDGAAWQAISSLFTVITDEQLNGDGTTTAFTLAGPTTTAGCVVSINGVLQVPTLAYAIESDGVTLTFTEAPMVGDLIDVRRLTTTSIVTALASVNGYMQILVDNNGVYIYTGSSGTTATTSWNPAGAKVNSSANVTVASANTATTIDSFSASTYRSARYVVQVTSGADYQVSEVMVLHDGSTAKVVEYGVLQTNGNLGIVEADVNGGNTRLRFVATNATNDVRITKDYNLI